MAIHGLHLGHLHRPHVHEAWSHLVHDGRFWAILAIILLAALMILAFITAQPGTNGTPVPIYPNYWPYIG